LRSHGARTDIYPHGKDLQTWIRATSGLPATKIDAVLAIL
jgi:hypothetical protein